MQTVIDVKKKEESVSYKYTIEVPKNIAHATIVRFIDFLLALIGLIVASPIIFVFMVLIRLEDQGPAFYKQERLGKNGKRFLIYKLRSMRMDAEKYGMQWAEENDPRITKVGKFIRLTRIDELPQMINILTGDMAIIGPRPERPELTFQFEEETPGFINRLAVKPGLTGWAQVNGGYEITPAEKAKLDVYYIENRNLKMDIKIVLMTIKVVVTGDGAR